jgi:hypothetical protein
METLWQIFIYSRTPMQGIIPPCSYPCNNAMAVTGLLSAASRLLRRWLRNMDDRRLVRPLADVTDYSFKAPPARA